VLDNFQLITNHSRITLFVILSVNWEKIRKISKTALIAALETCAKKFDRNSPIAAKKCRILISIINNPWENTLIDFLNSTKQPVKGDTKAPPPTYPVISNQSNSPHNFLCDKTPDR
jgi:hypothetical protein